ncbi:hypothetical protein V6B16_03740 [Salinimicrobium catena]|uniref:hypothetical protein n=1 Tax=Salinimicrobium catena TaxID=390640 RepID=UPI002FE4F5ED
MLKKITTYIMNDDGKLIAAAIGALVAIIIFIIKDIIMYEIRESKKRKKLLLDRKLTSIYGPLFAVCVTGQNSISTFMKDDSLFEKYTTNGHLLSDKLITYIGEYQKLGRGDLRDPVFSAGGDGQKALEISIAFSKCLENEFRKLRKKYIA